LLLKPELDVAAPSSSDFKKKTKNKEQGTKQKQNRIKLLIKINSINQKKYKS